jgi:citrate synthase
MHEKNIRASFSSYDNDSITVRGKDFGDEIISDLSFSAAVYFLWTGEEPSQSHENVLDAMLSSLLIHDTTPSGIASRMIARNEPEAIQAAVAGGVLGVGSGYLGTGKECGEILQQLASQSDTNQAVEQQADAYLEGDEQFPGIGHPIFSEDPRAEQLFNIAEEEEVAGKHTDILRLLQEKMEARTGTTLPINVIGANAALGSDIGLSPEAIRGIAIVSSAAGITGSVLEEKEHPEANNIWQLVEEHTTQLE